MSQYVITSPRRRSANQRVTVGNSTGTPATFNLGEAVTLTAEQVKELTGAGYGCSLLDAAGRAACAGPAALGPNAGDQGPTTLTLAAIAASATTAVVTHNLPALPAAASVLKLYRDRSGTITTQDTESYEASPQTMDCASANSGDKYWVEATYGGSAVVKSNVRTVA